MHIPEYNQGTWTNHPPRRKRKLLLHKQQILKMHAQVQEGGYTLVPLSLYFSDGNAKVELGAREGQARVRQAPGAPRAAGQPRGAAGDVDAPAPRRVRVAPDDPLAPDVRDLLDEHLAEMRRTSPPESVHALDPHALAADGILFLAARDDDGTLLGIGALKALSPAEGELKSMRTAVCARGRGVATEVLAAVLEGARARGMARVSLETGTEPFFDPAVRLYLRHGFVPCPPFADYSVDPNSRYLTLPL